MLKEGVSEREKYREKKYKFFSQRRKEVQDMERPWWTPFAEVKVRWKYLKGFYDALAFCQIEIQ